MTRSSSFYLNGFIAAPPGARLSGTLGNEERASPGHYRSHRGLPFQGRSLSPRTRETNGPARESVWNPNRKQDHTQPLRDFLPRREEEDQGRRRKDQALKAATSACHEPVSWEADHL